MPEEQTLISRVARDAVIFTLSVLTLLSVSLLMADNTFAQAEPTIEPTTKDLVAEAAQTVEFEFVAEPCDNLTKLVRRSILIYDENNQQVELSKSDIVFVETNVVQKMGAFGLDIGDEVVIDGGLIAKYAAEAQGLSEDQTAAWSVYVPVVDYQLDHTQQPDNLDQVVDVLSGATANNVDDVSDADSGATSVSAFWWFAGVGAALVVWYLLWRREEDAE